jgi:hypothetical protein
LAAQRKGQSNQEEPAPGSHDSARVTGPSAAVDALVAETRRSQGFPSEIEVGVLDRIVDLAFSLSTAARPRSRAPVDSHTVSVEAVARAGQIGGTDRDVVENECKDPSLSVGGERRPDIS